METGRTVETQKGLEEARLQASKRLLTAADVINTYVQGSGIYRGLPAHSVALDKVSLRGAPESLKGESEGEVLLGFADTQDGGQTFMPPQSHGLRGFSRQYGFFQKRTITGPQGAETHLIRITDNPSLASYFGNEKIDVFNTVTIFHAMQQQVGVVPSEVSTQAQRFNREFTALNTVLNDKFTVYKTMQNEEGRTLIDMYAFVNLGLTTRRRGQPRLSEGRPSLQMVRLVLGGNTKQEDLKRLFSSEVFLEELARYSQNNRHSQRLSHVRITEIARDQEGNINIPESTISFVFRNELGNKDDTSLFVSHLGLENSSQQRAADLITNALRANRSYRAPRKFERTEELLLGSLVVRVEGRQVHLLTKEGHSLKDSVALAAYMKDSGLDATETYSEVMRRFVGYGLSFPDEMMVA